jgi:hypothetical protein
MTDEEGAEGAEMRMLAFVIERFCGGKIEFEVGEISAAWDTIDIRRTYKDGRITYVTRRQADEPAF